MRDKDVAFPENEERKARRIKRNAAMCLKCNDKLHSTHRHDFVRCKCGSISIDGGNAYIRWIGDLHNIKDLTEYYDD